MIYLVVRGTLDWRNEALFRAQLHDEMRGPVELWNATFRMPYHIFRAELKALAEANWADLPGVTVVPIVDVPDGELVLPTDDDDWFSPRVGPTLEGARAAGSFLGYRWPGRHLEVPFNARHWFGNLRRSWLPNTPPTVLCATNAYAIVKRQDNADLVRSHVRASRWFKANPELTRSLHYPLSIANRSLASTTTFVKQGVFDRKRLLAKHGAYVRRYAKPLAPELNWAAPCVARMAELMAELA